MKLHLVRSLTPGLRPVSEDQHPIPMPRREKSPAMAAPTAAAEAVPGVCSGAGSQPWDHVTLRLANSSVLPT